MGKAKGEEQDIKMVKKIEEEEAIRLSFGWKPLPISENAPRYSYSFQCWGCTLLHQGSKQSDSKFLEIECDKCGKVNHCFGRKIKGRV